MTERRREQIVQLLASRYDGLYLPAGSLVTPSGFVPNRKEPCTDCGGLLVHDDYDREIRRRKGKGTIRDRYGRQQPCTNCGGHTGPDGEIVPGAGWIARDPMDTTGARVGSSSTTATARPERTVLCDACAGEGVRHQERCVYCDGQGRRQLHAFNLHLQPEDDADADPLDDAIDRRNAPATITSSSRRSSGSASTSTNPSATAGSQTTPPPRSACSTRSTCRPQPGSSSSSPRPNAPSSTSPSRTSTAGCPTRSVSPPPSAQTSSSSPAAAPARKAEAPTRTRLPGVTRRSGSTTGRAGLRSGSPPSTASPSPASTRSSTA
jgi:hypothetical protein